MSGPCSFRFGHDDLEIVDDSAAPPSAKREILSMYHYGMAMDGLVDASAELPVPPPQTESIASK